MAINKNNKAPLKKQVKTVSVKDRLQQKLKESYDEFLTEDDEDLDNTDLDTSDDESSDDDFGGFDDETGDDSDMGDDEGFGDDEFSEDEDELSPDQEEFFDDQIDLLLEPAVEEAELGDDSDDSDDSFETGDENFEGDDEEDSLLGEADEFGDDDFGGFDDETGDDIDIESDSDDFSEFEDDVDDFSGEEDDMFLGANELQDIIDAPNTYDLLGDTLDDAAVEEFPSEGGGEFGDLDNELDAETEVDAELEEAMKLAEARLRARNKKIATTKKMPSKNKLSEDVTLTSELKSLDFEEDEPELEGTYAKVSKGDGKNSGKVEHKKALTTTMKQEVKESIEKSKMLVKAAKKIDTMNNKIKVLQLENYQLTRINGILSAAGDKLDKASRIKISETFTKCASTAQVNTLYEKIVTTIKNKLRPSLNEAIGKAKKASSVKTVKSLNEGVDKNNDGLSREQQRINHLMGLKTKDDVYFKF